jgi:hypothetical protein
MLNRLIEAALVVVLAAAAAGQLPRFVQTVRVAQLQLLKDSQSSKWGRPMLLPIRKNILSPAKN